MLVIVLAKTPEPQRFGKIKESIEGISAKVLTQTLRSMERDGLVHRTVIASMPPRVDYNLTPLGKTLIEPVEALRKWAEHNVAAVLAARERYDNINSPAS